MADPTRFVKSFVFQDFQETQPSTPLPGIQVDSQLDDITESTTSLVNAVKDIRRSDGALKNKIVTSDSLADGLLDMLSSETGATEAAASAASAAASAADAALAASELATVAQLITDGGFYADWGDFHSVPGESRDYGSFH